MIKKNLVWKVLLLKYYFAPILAINWFCILLRDDQRASLILLFPFPSILSIIKLFQSSWIWGIWACQTNAFGLSGFVSVRVCIWGVVVKHIDREWPSICGKSQSTRAYVFSVLRKKQIKKSFISLSVVFTICFIENGLVFVYQSFHSLHSLLLSGLF